LTIAFTLSEFYAKEGMKRPFNPSGTVPDFYEGKGDARMITNNGLQLSLPDLSIPTFKI
jgi:hypothetical protein